MTVNDFPLRLDRKMSGRQKWHQGRSCGSAAPVNDLRVFRDQWPCLLVGSDSRGFDGGKLINGRKRHAVVDTLGLLLGVVVTVADTGDRTAARALLREVADAPPARPHLGRRQLHMRPGRALPGHVSRTCVPRSPCCL
ncbi:hypothetical protein CTU88_03930 [Streptomyces sp. JV178]|nr:hypothetical protein CTU88_03930 [Streptomyces sp. JV178]